MSESVYKENSIMRQYLLRSHTDTDASKVSLSMSYVLAREYHAFRTSFPQKKKKKKKSRSLTSVYLTCKNNVI